MEPRDVQFWSDIILVISNRFPFPFEIAHMISAQIAPNCNQTVKAPTLDKSLGCA